MRIIAAVGLSLLATAVLGGATYALFAEYL